MDFKAIRVLKEALRGMMATFEKSHVIEWAADCVRCKRRVHGKMIFVLGEPNAAIVGRNGSLHSVRAGSEKETGKMVKPVSGKKRCQNR